MDTPGPSRRPSLFRPITMTLSPCSAFPRLRPDLARCAAFLLSLTGLSAQEIVPASSVRISATDTITRPADDPLVLGWNVAWQKFQINFWDSNSQTADANVRAFLTDQLPGALYRYPGGTVSSYFDWRETVGPVSDRSVQYTDNQGYVFPYFGVDEFLRLVEEIGGQPLLGVPLHVDDHPSQLLTPEQIPEWAQRAADLVEYCNAPNDGSNPGGGTDWAAVRAANGHPAPYDVRHWELDNETDHGANSIGAVTYADRCAQLIAAMRAIDPDISIMAHARTSLEERDNWRNWHETVITRLAGQVDMIAAHPYYDGIQVPVKLNSLTTIRADALALAPAFPPTVAVTEHATWTTIDNSNFNARNSSIVGAIGTSDFIMGAAQREGVSLATMHLLDGSGWWLAYSQPAGVWEPRPVSRSLSLIHAILHSHEILDTTVRTPNTSGYNGGYDVRGVVTRQPGTSQYAVGFVNRAGGAHPAEIAIDGLGESPLELTFSYLTDPAENLGSNANLDLQTTTLTVTPVRTGNTGAFIVTLPAKSVGTLTFDAGNLPPAVALTSPASGSTFVLGESVSLSATATDPDGVALVEFYRDGTDFLADDSVAPYTATWLPGFAGTFDLTAVAHDGGDPVASAASAPASITVAPNLVPTIVTTALPDPVFNADYQRTLEATPGNGALTFSLRAGTLPTGLTLSGDGIISGQATRLGKRHIVVAVADADGNTGSTDEDLQALSLHVRLFQWGDPPPPEGVEGTVLRVNAGSHLSHVDNAGAIWLADQGFSGGHTVHRPPFNIAGTEDDPLYRTEHYGMTAFSAPVENGRYYLSLLFAENDRRYDRTGDRVFSVSAEDTAPAALQNIDIAAAVGFRTALVKTVEVEVLDGQLDLAFTATAGPTLVNGIALLPIPNSIPAILTTDLPGAGVDLAFTAALTAEGGDGTLVWTLESGALPAGLTLAADGTLSGAPTEAGAFPITVRVADSDHRTGEADEDVVGLVLKVRPTTLRIEAGSPGAYTDTAGRVWSPDSGFFGANSGTVDRGAIPIAYTEDDKIYQTEHYGLDGFSAQVADGDYMLNLHFAETFSNVNSVGSRVFSVGVEDSSPARLQNIDLFAAVGRDAAHIISVPVTITDHALDLTFAASARSPLVNGLELVRYVDTVPNVTTTTLPGAVATVSYFHRLAVSDANGAAFWSVDSGSLPDGLTLAPNGVIAGTPTSSGSSTFTVRVADSDAAEGSGDESTAALTLVVSSAPTSLTFTSTGDEDGWVLEVDEFSDIGDGFSVGNFSNNAAIRVGDDASRKQFKGFVSFDTSGLPDNAVLVSATLRLTRGTISFNVNAFGTLYADVATGGFNGDPALEAADFEAPATAPQSVAMSFPASNGAVSAGELEAAGVTALNKIGKTQFRLRFLVDDNNNTLANYLGFWSGGATNAAHRPALEVTYYLP